MRYQWIYVFLALTHRNITLRITQKEILMSLNVTISYFAFCITIGIIQLNPSPKTEHHDSRQISRYEHQESCFTFHEANSMVLSVECYEIDVMILNCQIRKKKLRFCGYLIEIDTCMICMLHLSNIIVECVDTQMWRRNAFFTVWW